MRTQKRKAKKKEDKKKEEKNNEPKTWTQKYKWIRSSIECRSRWELFFNIINNLRKIVKYKRQS